MAMGNGGMAFRRRTPKKFGESLLFCTTLDWTQWIREEKLASELLQFRTTYF
jgi:hypothetical protein